MAKFLIGCVIGVAMTVSMLLYFQSQNPVLSGAATDDMLNDEITISQQAPIKVESAQDGSLTNEDTAETAHSNNTLTLESLDHDANTEAPNNESIWPIDEDTNQYGIPHLMPGRKAIPIDGNVLKLLRGEPVRPKRKFAPKSFIWKLAKAHRDLENETRDLTWAHFTETSFTSFLLNHDNFARSFKEVFIECRTNACEYKLTSSAVSKMDFSAHAQIKTDFRKIMFDINSQPWWLPMQSVGPWHRSKKAGAKNKSYSYLVIAKKAQ